tara:strand:- start:95 stop:355 length:261 start_codon:yes stop_codon:yes gene_type:complete
MSDPYLAHIEKEKKLSQEIVSLREEVKTLKADVKYERELRVKGTAYHPTDYHSRLREMISKVRKEKKLTDLFDIVDEAQKRLRDAD